MNKLRHPVGALVVFGVLLGLLILGYEGLQIGYNITSTDTMTVEYNGTNQSGDIATQLQRINLIEGVGDINRALTSLSAEGAGLDDIVGALAGVGLGVIKTVIGLLTAPYSVTRIIVGFYAGEVPGIIAGLIGIITTYIGFIMLSAYLGKDV